MTKKISSKIKEEAIAQTIGKTHTKSSKKLKIGIFLVVTTFIIIYGLIFTDIYNILKYNLKNIYLDFTNQNPKVLLSVAVGQQIIEPRNVEIYVRDFLILKLPKNEFKFIIVLKRDENFHGLINDLYFSDKECLECIHFTIRVTNIGRVPIKQITIEADTYTNKINFLQADPKIKCSENTGTYGYGKIYCKVSELNVKERASFNIQINSPKKDIPFTCLINDEKTCNLEFFYYQTGLFDPKSINYDNTTIMIPKNLKEGFYKLDWPSGSLVPLKATVISESFEK